MGKDNSKKSPVPLIRKSLIFLLVAFFFGQTAQAQDFDLYVYNKHLETKIISIEGVIYVPAQDLAKALKLDLKKDKNTVLIGTPPEKPVEGKLILDGKAMPDAIQGKDGILYVPLKSFAAATGNKILYNKETKIIDVIPGSSLLTNTVVGNLEKSTFFSQPSPQPSSSSNSQNRQSGDSKNGQPGSASSQGASSQTGLTAPDLSKQMEELKEKYSKSLETRANFLQYFINLENWADQETTEGNRFLSRLNQVKGINDQNQAATELADLFQSFSNTISQDQQSFYQIAPPSEFQKSHAILRQMVDRYPQIQSIMLQGSHVVLGFRTANPEQAVSLMNKMQDLMSQIRQVDAQQRQDEINYLRAFKTDLDNLR